MIPANYEPQPGDRVVLPLDTLDAAMAALMTLPAGQVIDVIVAVREQAEIVKEQR